MVQQTEVTRRELLSGAAAGSVALAASSSLRPTAAVAQTSGGTPLSPNILFILADDLGYADLSCYGRRDFSTPNIDRVAADGMRFMQAYANSAVCHRFPRGADHGAISVPVGDRVGRAPCRPR